MPISQLTIKDYDKFQEYTQHVPETLAKFSGKLVIASPNVEVMEGSWDQREFIALEFPALEKAKPWYQSLDKKPIMLLSFLLTVFNKTK